MKKEQLPLVILALISLGVTIWALQLQGSNQNLKNKKKELESRLSQAVKDKEFMRAQLGDLEKRLEVEVEQNHSLAEQLDQAENTVEKLQRQVVGLTKAKQELESEISLLKGKEVKTEEVAKPVESTESEVRVLPQTPGAGQQESPPLLEDDFPLPR